MKNEKKTTMSVEKAGEKLGICYAVALKAAKSGELPSIRIGKRFLSAAGAAAQNARRKAPRVKNTASIVEVVESAGVSLRRQGNQLVGLCPFHADKKSASP